ncbi:MAG: Rho termination factor N-terminal domain-containing protein [bacterium]
MKHIKMISTEFVQTNRGAMKFTTGQDYLVEDWIASSLIGRGLAEELIPPTPPEEPKEIDYASMTVKELRIHAEKAGVPGFKKLKKDDLTSALEPLKPPPTPFEEIKLN